MTNKIIDFIKEHATHNTSEYEFMYCVPSKLSEELRTELTNILLAHPFFGKVETIEYIDKPIMLNELGEEGRANVTLTYLIKDEVGKELSSKVMIYSLGLNGKTYDTNEIVLGHSVSPVMYNPKNFNPIKYIKLTVSPQNILDESAISGIDSAIVAENKLRELFEEALLDFKNNVVTVPYKETVNVRLLTVK